MDEKNEKTTVDVEDINIENLLDDNEAPQQKKGLLDDLNPMESSMEEFFGGESEEKKPEEKPEEKLDTTNIPTEKEEKKETPKGKNAYVKSLIDSGVLLGFDDGKSVEDYDENDIKDLIETNIKEIKKSATDEVAKEFFEELPQEIQAAYEYVKSGGSDIKGMLRALSASREISDYDISGKNGQKGIIKAYLLSTNYGTEEEIDDEIASIEDRGELEKKANQFKPKLEAMQQQVIRERIAAQKQEDERRKKIFEHYEEGVYNALNKDELNGIHVTKSIRNKLYNGLLRPDYETASGRKTNQLMHLIEKYQFIEPRQDLLAETLWLLSDPQGYKEAVSKSAVMKNNEETARKLKTIEQSRETTNNNPTQQRTLSRPMKRGIFD